MGECVCVCVSVCLLGGGVVGTELIWTCYL